MNDHLFELLIALIGILLTAILGWIGKGISDLVKNVQVLNEKMVAVLERVNVHESRITRLEKRKV